QRAARSRRAARDDEPHPHVTGERQHLRELRIVAKCLDNMLSYCDKNKIEVVVIPLLGTGVGGLNKESVLDLYEKKLENSRTTFKVIHYKK
ncbi:macro domain-containing protein, partial [Streptomyces sp. NPDC013130]|uniref:macro domain-containing protein n=1 Tax=Streptomyces sp. NPDC013130 TaxID=3156695 RepID=UPI003404EC2D